MLSKLSGREIAAFNKIFHQLLLDSYRWDLWGAAYVLSEGVCSDYSFEYFRSWLISMGEEVYGRALENPDTLVEPTSQPGIEDIFFEEFAYAASEVYFEKKEKNIPESGISFPPAPLGEPWLKEPEELSRRYPQLWAKFGWQEK
jgi:hypothetical protein